jgi:hypothetical protein
MASIQLIQLMNVVTLQLARLLHSCKGLLVLPHFEGLLAHLKGLLALLHLEIKLHGAPMCLS